MGEDPWRRKSREWNGGKCKKMLVGAAEKVSGRTTRKERDKMSDLLDEKIISAVREKN